MGKVNKRPKLTRDYVVILPAYNEAHSIKDALEGIYSASLIVPQRLRKIILCLNGCTDDTEKIIRNWHKLPLTVIKSSPGYINAMNRLIGHTQQYYPDDILVKTDADGVLDINALKYLFGQLEKHPNVVVAGGHPVPKISPDLSLKKRLLGSILSVRGRYPVAEIAVKNVAKYHPYVATDPLPGIGVAEKRLKIYFHGRLWCARSVSYIRNLEDSVLGDDVYLPGWMFNKYGYDCIRLDYRANVYFHPNDSLRRHWKVYKRIYEDRRRVYMLPGFEEYADNCPLKLDWKYIVMHVPFREILNFIAYAMIVRIEKITFALTEYRESYWQYQEKEV